MILVIREDATGKAEVLYSGKCNTEALKVFTEKSKDSKSFKELFLFNKHSYRVLGSEEKKPATKKAAARKNREKGKVKNVVHNFR